MRAVVRWVPNSIRSSLFNSYNKKVITRWSDEYCPSVISSRQVGMDSGIPLDYFHTLQKQSHEISQVSLKEVKVAFTFVSSTPFYLLIIITTRWQNIYNWRQLRRNRPAETNQINIKLPTFCLKPEKFEPCKGGVTL